MMNLNQKRRDAALAKELLAVEKQEKKMEQAALKAKPAAWKTELESRIPENVYTGLESAFCKGFGLVFDQGRAIIEKGYNKENIQADHSIRDFAVQVKGGRKELRKMHKSAKQSDLLNLAVTTVEGVGLGALGVGMPDIVLFLGTLLKGVYETALNYGFDYESRQEQIFILKMMQTALSTGEDWVHRNTEVDEMLTLETVGITDEDFKLQMKETASAFAVDMLLLKFIQGLPVVGVIGGAANPVYYSKVMKYVQMKYRKRYLLKQKGATSNEISV
ncbi:MAG: EcsC family protein [Oscillospiraceae bacterium]|nr:EcsC family protein [Oscillospiraceae bacterium]MBQ9167363.1 EcsC family protein [Oscillospiraceae bacterium]